MIKMKLIELKPQGQVDLMTTMMLGQAMYLGIDKTLSDAEKSIVNQKASLIGAIFCGVCIKMTENGWLLSPTLMAINEPEIADGVYAYITQRSNQGIPEIGTKSQGDFMVYGTVDLTDPRVEVYYGSELVCTVNIIVDGKQVVPKVSDCRTTDSQLNDSDYKVIEDAINENVMGVHLSFVAGYKAGYDAATAEGEADDE